LASKNVNGRSRCRRLNCFLRVMSPAGNFCAFRTLPLRRAVLAACIAAAATPAADSVAAITTVTNCNGSGNGSLRKAGAGAGRHCV
jgi:hypothetical protein